MTLHWWMHWFWITVVTHSLVLLFLVCGSLPASIGCISPVHSATSQSANIPESGLPEGEPLHSTQPQNKVNCSIPIAELQRNISTPKSRANSQTSKDESPSGNLENTLQNRRESKKSTAAGLRLVVRDLKNSTQAHLSLSSHEHNASALLYSNSSLHPNIRSSKAISHFPSTHSSTISPHLKDGDPSVNVDSDRNDSKQENSGSDSDTDGLSVIGLPAIGDLKGQEDADSLYLPKASLNSTLPVPQKDNVSEITRERTVKDNINRTEESSRVSEWLPAPAAVIPINGTSHNKKNSTEIVNQTNSDRCKDTSSAPYSNVGALQIPVDEEHTGNITVVSLGQSASHNVEETTSLPVSVAPVSKSRVAAAPSPDVSPQGLDAASITGISLGIVVFAGLAGATSFILYRRRYLNKPQTLNDKCSNPDSSGYIDDSTLRENSEEMYSLDNDSFLNSLEAMTIQNYWTDNQETCWHHGQPCI